MRIIVCLDDNYGMMFNRRRQSKDRVLTEDIVEMTTGQKLWMNAYSEQLFEGKNVVVEEAFLENAEEEDFCFVENQSLQPYADRVKEVILYKWNRKYPSDFCFDMDLSVWKLVEEKEFAGSSHEKITRERYEKRG